MLPAIKGKMKQVQEAFSKVDAKAMTSKLHQAVNFMKKKMMGLKKSSENNEIAIKVNNKDAQKQISQVQKRPSHCKCCKFNGMFQNKDKIITHCQIICNHTKSDNT